MSAKAEDAERGSSPAVAEDANGVRRRPTYTFRLSIDDMSLRTLPLAELPSSIPGRASSIVPSVYHTADGLESVGTWRTTGTFPTTPVGLDDRRLSGLTVGTEDGSFFTARGTMRSWIEGLCEDDAAETEDVVVVWHTPRAVPRSPSDAEGVTGSDGDTTLVEPSAPVSPRWEWKHRLATDTVRSDDTTPLPSRVLYILHPPPRPRTPSPAASTSSVQPLALLMHGRVQAEKAFWRMFLPPLAGLMHMTQSLSGTMSSLADYVSFSMSSLTSADGKLPSERPVPRTYACETVYTLRMPIPDEDSCTMLDLENTVRPALVRKRAGMPTWSDDSGGIMEEIGRAHV